MNKNLENAINNAAKIDAIMYAMDHTFSDLIVKPEYIDEANRAQNAFYTAWDLVTQLQDDLEKLRGDEQVVNVILAAKRPNNLPQNLDK